MAPTIEFLSKYLSFEWSNGSMELYLPDGEDEVDEDDEDDEEDTDKNPSFFWKESYLRWNGQTCLAVVLYVIKFDDIVLSNVVKTLDDLARKYELEMKNPEKNRHNWEEFSNIFVNSFMPRVRKFFKVPKLHELSNKNNSLKENEILASFMDFLLQILNCETHINSTEEQRYAVLQKELTFLLSLLGDIPFQCTELEQVKNILAEFEILANEAGRFIYSCIFSIFQIKSSRFIKEKTSFLKMVEVLNVKIKEHCTKLSELRPFVVSRTYDAIDLIFIVDSLIEDLENLMNNQIHLIIDEMKVQIIALHKELTISRSLLEEIRMSHDMVHMDELNESLVHIRDVAYEVEYLVNSYVVDNLPLWYLNLRLPIVIPKFKLIRMRFQKIKIIYDIKVLDIKKDFSGEISNQVMRTRATMNDDIVVGFEDESANISNDLLGGSRHRQIVSIVGMPGLGKTTIANKLYIARSITDHFDKRGWCVISQTYRKRNVLIDILISLSKPKVEEKNSILEMDNESLSLKIHQCLKNRRYLVVIDDVWSTNVWDDLGRFFPDDGNGSRIILTSRVREISPTNSIVHSLSLLEEDQCWSLLKNKVFPEEPCPQELQDIGKRIAAKCGGLPLALVVTAGVLANLEKKKNIWEKVETNLNSYIFGDDTYNYSKILELSFKHLPDHLKMCFLYIGAFPEDTQIPVEKLIWLWIAEGFIQRDQEKSPELVGEEYLSDLINRSLVLISKRRSDGGIRACNIHDLLREMCLRKAHEEKNSKFVDNCLSLYEKHHRIFVQLEASAGGRPFGLYYRSFSGHLSHPSSQLPQMKLLRVMNLRSISGRSYELKRINLLVHLRYLAVDRMPEPLVGYFVNLECLIIDGDETTCIPLVILKLVKLRHVKISFAVFEEDCYSCQTTNLRSLSNIWILNDKDEEILRRSPYLRKLKCYYYYDTLFPNLHSLTDFQTLNLTFSSYFSGELTKVNFSSNIKNLRLDNLGLPWEEMSIIGRLPNLHVLKLSNHAFVGEKWETRDGEFQELRVLKLLCNDSIKQWITCSEHFPQLQSLIVFGCINLKEIPSEIGDIPTLQKIEVNNSGHEVHKSVVQIEQEQRENGNEELQVINCDEENMEDMVEYFKQQDLLRSTKR